MNLSRDNRSTDCPKGQLSARRRRIKVSIKLFTSSNIVMSQPQTVSNAEASAEMSPFVVEFFMVESLGFRGMAFCDEDGHWRNAFNNDPLPGQIYLVE